ncbi:MAG TPA: benzaldehyde dehydrogenase [Polyangiaceae bacterium]|nr:benzaldehyde dehydrogenase [Polyangiaceae bacterium]
MTTSQSGPVLEGTAWQGKLFNGEWIAARGGSIEIREPANGKLLGRSGLGNAADVAAAARHAASAQPAWAATPVRDRAELLYRVAAYLQRNAEELAGFIARETGGTFLKGMHEVREAQQQLKAAAALTLQPDGVTLPSTPGRLSIAKRVPLGVIGVISPFNFPLILSARAVAPAIAVGNGVVLKPDAQTPVTGGMILALAFSEAGLPKGVLQVVPGDVEAGEALCTDPNIQMISFTGSTATGRRVGELAGKHLKKVALELGGKNSLIVLDDADLDLAAKNVAWGAYLHQGQICMATGRVLVHEKIAAALTSRLVEKAKHLPVGDPAAGNVALGPLINERQRDRVHAIVTQAVQEGAKLEAGGAYNGLFYQPTVLTGVRSSMRAFREEVFGPVANLTTFSSDEEAIALANDTEYGLSAAVLSRSIGRAMAVAERLKAGLVHVNDQTVNDEVLNPFGGTGASGNHTSMGGPADIGEYTQWRWMTVRDSAPPYPF